MKTRAINIQFDISFIFSIRLLLLDIYIKIIEFNIVEVDISFLLCFKDMDKLNIYFNNLENILIILEKLVLVIYYLNHQFLLRQKPFQLFIAYSFNKNFCFLIDTKLRQLYYYFIYLKLHKILRCIRHKTDKKIIDNLIKNYIYC